ncbi:hypothetical protein J6590_001727 [Homalodisca vitripennis]|nr:hypothetical protein J6590_001727 [Homalodisca vitripennis]
MVAPWLGLLRSVLSRPQITCQIIHPLTSSEIAPKLMLRSNDKKNVAYTASVSLQDTRFNTTSSGYIRLACNELRLCLVNPLAW